MSMTKAELRRKLSQGCILDDLFHFKDGQECMIYKADNFVKGTTIIYIPDIDLNRLPVDEVISDPEELTEVVKCCYTGDDFVEECGGDEEMAERLFWYCDWQHPSSAYPEICDGDEGDAMAEKEFYEHRLEESRKALMALIAKVEHPGGDKLSEILVEAVNKIEKLQEEEPEPAEGGF